MSFAHILLYLLTIDGFDQTNSHFSIIQLAEKAYFFFWKLFGTWPTFLARVICYRGGLGAKPPAATFSKIDTWNFNFEFNSRKFWEQENQLCRARKFLEIPVTSGKFNRALKSGWTFWISRTKASDWTAASCSFLKHFVFDNRFPPGRV